jgi:predicted metal-binding protein
LHDHIHGAGEAPVVFSKTFQIRTEYVSTAAGVAQNLKRLAEMLLAELEQAGAFIGHIKAIADIGEDRYIWLSTTGTGISIKQETGRKHSDTSEIHQEPGDEQQMPGEIHQAPGCEQCDSGDDAGNGSSYSLDLTAIIYRIGKARLEKAVLGSLAAIKRTTEAGAHSGEAGELYDRLIREAMDQGASDASVINTSGIVFHEEFRQACEKNLCRRYDTTWSGPPAVGSVSELRKRTEAFRKALLIQNTCQLEDSFDVEGMQEGARIHDERFRKILYALRSKYEFEKLLPLGAGCCSLCESCAYLDGEPCRNPDEAVSSVECYGIDVTALKKSAGWSLSGGLNTVSYIALIFFL